MSMEKQASIAALRAGLESVIVGQSALLDRLVVGLLTGGHILVEGLPGLAKTTAIKALAAGVHAGFKRIQFTPDLLPGDLTGTDVYNPREGSFCFVEGPLFHEIILADEINRAPAKVQSALLEAMQERQVTIGDTTYKLEDPFMVLATQNPIEQEGTYPLPEAQVDRFLFKLVVHYPTRTEEQGIIDLMTSVSQPGGAFASLPKVQPVVSPQDIREARAVIDQIYIDDKVKSYILNLVGATRNPDQFKVQFRTKDNRPLEQVISIGASPRASIALVVAAKTHAFLRHRGHVTPDDVKAIGPDVLRHRIQITFEAEAEELKTDDVVRQIFDQIEVP